MRSTGGAVLTALDALVGAATELDPADLCVTELQALTAGLAAACERLGGVQSAALGELVARSGGTVPGAPAADGAPAASVLVRHWWRDTTGTDPRTAGREVRGATLLRELPRVLAAVRDGRLTMAHALVLTRLVGAIDAAALTDAQDDLVAVACQCDPHELGVYVTHLIATWCEPQFDADMRSQHDKRYLQTSREDDGMLSGRFRLTTADSEVLLTLLEPLARRTSLADDRDAGQRRADALVEVCAQNLAFGDLGDAGGVRPTVAYVVPAAWAAGQSPVGTFAELVRGNLPDDLFGPGPLAGLGVEGSCAIGAWSGPQTRTLVEQVLCDARLTRVLLDERGQVTGLEALGDTITKAQRRALAARDHGCAARGCTRPPAMCDAHHVHHRADAGTTSLDNLVLLCRYHHTRWHQGRLHLRDLHVPWLTRADPPLARTG